MVRTQQKIYDMAARNIQLAASALTVSVWKHGCSCYQLEDHRVSDIIIKNSTTTLIAEDLRLYSVTLCCTPLAFQHVVLS